MNQIVNGKGPISTETALRLATYFGTSSQLWVNLQKNDDLRIAERDLLPHIQQEVKLLKLDAAQPPSTPNTSVVLPRHSKTS